MIWLLLHESTVKAATLPGAPQLVPPSWNETKPGDAPKLLPLTTTSVPCDADPDGVILETVGLADAGAISGWRNCDAYSPNCGTT
jgi:hypothetical protein